MDKNTIDLQNKIIDLQNENKRLNTILETFNNPDINHSKKFFISLMKEIPPNTIVMHYMTGKITAHDVILSLSSSDNDSLGRQYISDLLRVSRDLQSRKIN